MKSVTTLGRIGVVPATRAPVSCSMRHQRVNTPAKTRPSQRTETEFNQWIREGHTEAEYVQKQANKGKRSHSSTVSIGQSLTTWDTEQLADVAIVGCGPAGLALAAETAKHHRSVVLIGEDVPFVNNYGVWVDEFEEAGLEETLENIWPQAVCFFGEEQKVIVDRRYGRVNLDKLLEILIRRCQDAGVAFHSGFVESIDTDSKTDEAQIKCKDSSINIKSRMVTLASGAAAGKLLKYESGVPSPGAQTAYGIEVEVEGYSERYPGNMMLFMDYRRHHSGLWPGTAPRIKAGAHPNGGDGLWSSHGEVPSFLYAMPLGGNRVFLEETCLVAKPPLPFAHLKRRLARRIEAMGLSVKQMYDEEWSYIPVGGPLPIEDQPVTAFGSAASLIHPASGYSISRSLREAPGMADAIKNALATGGTVHEMSKHVWRMLWTTERRTQASFHVFGMELLAQLELSQVNNFFKTFFKLPPYYWKGFLSSSITSEDLLVFAIVTFIIAPPSIKTRLIAHLIIDPSGGHMLKKYFGKYASEIQRLLRTDAATESTE